MDAKDREELELKLVEDMLARGLNRSVRRERGACPQPEVLAAYVDKHLSTPEKQELEAHISDCWHCQDTLAALVVSEPVSETQNERAAVPAMEPSAAPAGLPIAARLAKPTLPERFEVAPAIAQHAIPAAAYTGQTVPQSVTWTQRKTNKRDRYIRLGWRWGWLVPATAGAALALWLSVFRPQVRPEFPEVAMRAPAPASPAADLPSNAAPPASKQEATPTPASAPARASARNLNGKSLSSENARDDAGKKRRSGASSHPEPSAARATPERSEPSGARATTEATGGAGGVLSRRAEAKNETRDAEPRQAIDRTALRRTNSGTPESAGMVPSAQGQATAQGAAAPPPAAGSQVYRSKMMQGKLSAEKTESAANPSGFEPSKSPMGERALSKPRVISTLDPAVVWRVGAAGLIERSEDGGQTWRSQASRITSELTAGYAVTAKICWVAGAGGVILRTTDGGEHWERIAAPANANWMRIFATDAEEAVITSVDGKRYVTTDGGRSWK